MKGTLTLTKKTDRGEIRMVAAAIPSIWLVQRISSWRSVISFLGKVLADSSLVLDGSDLSAAEMATGRDEISD